MDRRNFRELLEERWAEGKFVCVGLDSEFTKIPEAAHRPGVGVGVDPANTIVAFNRAIVEVTHDLVCAYKPNVAFYEAYGPEGMMALQQTIADIHAIAPDVPVILDAKRGDIDNTNLGYVAAAFDYLEADGITVHPYLGAESLQKFLACTEKGIFVLCLTSNSGAGEFQRLILKNDEPLYRFVARRVASEWNKNNNCGLVVGAMYPDELSEVRGLVGDMPILMPGVGFQQKDVPLEKQVEQVVSAGKDSRGRGMVVNSSRGIIFALKGADFAEAARRETQRLHDLINRFR
ncbi:MAG: orotidine-5'-phosphate decarboxylase [Patescibacteria group bacterium]